VTRRGARRAALAVALAVSAIACTHAPTRSVRPEAPAAGGAEQRPPERGQIGLASYYARKFQGRRTASGERYRSHELTCAHRTAPFGSRLRVTALETGRSVVVTVTDRGPYSRGRVVDVSRAAARALGMIDHGVIRVRVEPVDEDTAVR
jgi:rare lipoprotein A